MTLCRHCIDRLEESGKIVYVYSMEMDYETSIERDAGCDFCSQHDDLYECSIES